MHQAHGFGAAALSLITGKITGKEKNCGAPGDPKIGRGRP